MKSNIRVLTLSAILCLVGFLCCRIYSGLKKKSTDALKTASLPNFTFKNVNGADVNRQNISGKPLWLIFFDSKCEICQLETENIRRDNKIGNIQILMVSSEPLDTLAAFGKRYDLENSPTVLLLNDPKHTGNYTFNVNTTPTSFLYDSDGSLIKRYNGLVRTEIVMRDLEIGNTR